LTSESLQNTKKYTTLIHYSLDKNLNLFNRNIFISTVLISAHPKWLTGGGCTPTWKALCAALRAPAVDETYIADRIEEERLSPLEDQDGVTIWRMVGLDACLMERPSV